MQQIENEVGSLLYDCSASSNAFVFISQCQTTEPSSSGSIFAHFHRNF